jgi:predicted amidohydrolase
VKIATAQIDCALGDIPSNIRTIARFAKDAHDAGAEMVVFPEIVDIGYGMDSIRRHATEWTAGAVPAIQQLARNLALGIVCGVSEREGEAIFNSQVVVGPDGKTIVRYRKTHLFTPEPVREDTCFTPGREMISFETKGFRFGLTICYDLRFPELFRRLALDQHVAVFVLSSAWPCPRAHHFRTLAVARAIENQAFFVAANRVGTDAGIRFCGQSVIVDPTGAILASASDSAEELILADLSMETLSTVRAQMPVFEHRRRDLYA